MATFLTLSDNCLFKTQSWIQSDCKANPLERHTNSTLRSYQSTGLCFCWGSWWGLTGLLRDVWPADVWGPSLWQHQWRGPALTACVEDWQTHLLLADPQHWCVLSPLLCSMFTYDCATMHSSSVIFKFADEMTIMGLITVNDETDAGRKWRQYSFVSTSVKLKLTAGRVSTSPSTGERISSFLVCTSQRTSPGYYT